RPSDLRYERLVSFDRATTGAFPEDNVIPSSDGSTLYGLTQAGALTIPRRRKNTELCCSDGESLARISHNGIISRAASAENAFTSMIRGDQHYCHGDRQAIGRRWQRFGFVRAYARFAGIAIPSLPIRQITRR